MKTTTNLGVQSVGTFLNASTVNDAISVATSADDAALGALLNLQPPAGASITNVNTGVLPFQPDFVQVSGRVITVKPARYLRSATDNTHAMSGVLSMLVEVDTALSTLAAPAGASTWGFDLLYAVLTWTGAGVLPTVSFAIATATYASTASAPPQATIPANTSTSWVIPLKWIRNVNGATNLYADDLFDVVNNARAAKIYKLAAILGGVDSGMARSVTFNPIDLATGGSSPAKTASMLISSTTTNNTNNGHPPQMARTSSYVRRWVILPKEITGGTSGALSTPMLVDDSCDWRYGMFRTTWVNGITSDTSIAPYALWKMASANATNGTVCESMSQTTKTVAWNGSGFASTARLWVALFYDNAASAYVMGLYADPSTGALYYINQQAGAAAGSHNAILIEGDLFASFTH